ncbi:MAG: hypothetical protein ACQETH_05170 [Candidatus Rifleibacteriota bacterium]
MRPYNIDNDIKKLRIKPLRRLIALAFGITLLTLSVTGCSSNLSDQEVMQVFFEIQRSFDAHHLPAKLKDVKVNLSGTNGPYSKARIITVGSLEATLKALRSLETHSKKGVETRASMVLKRKRLSPGNRPEAFSTVTTELNIRIQYGKQGNTVLAPGSVAELKKLLDLLASHPGIAWAEITAYDSPRQLSFWADSFQEILDLKAKFGEFFLTELNPPHPGAANQIRATCYTSFETPKPQNKMTRLTNSFAWKIVPLLQAIFDQQDWIPYRLSFSSLIRTENSFTMRMTIMASLPKDHVGKLLERVINFNSPNHHIFLTLCKVLPVQNKFPSSEGLVDTNLTYEVEFPMTSSNQPKQVVTIKTISQLLRRVRFAYQTSSTEQTRGSLLPVFRLQIQRGNSDFLIGSTAQAAQAKALQKELKKASSTFSHVSLSLKHTYSRWDIDSTPKSELELPGEKFLLSFKLAPEKP